MMMTIAAAIRTRSSSSIGIVTTIRTTTCNTTGTTIDNGSTDLVRDVTK